MTAEEAEEQPAGKGRDEPDALPEPKYAASTYSPFVKIREQLESVTF